MTEREVLKLALEAMEGLINKTSGQAIYSFMETERRIAMSACVAIKEALAQPEQEPVAKNEGGRITWLVDDWPANCLLYAEPPSWTPVEIGVDVINEGTYVVGMYVLMPDVVRHVFYSQFHPSPQRKPLSDEEIKELYGDDDNFRMTKKYVTAFARAIEAAHGIKGEA